MKFNCLKLYKKLSPDCQLIFDDKKYLIPSGDIPADSRYYSSDPSLAPTNTKSKQKQKYEAHLLV